VVVILILFYNFFFKDIEKKEITKNENNVEIIDNQDNTLKDAEVDIEEIEKRLDELDINLDDIFEQLD
jgi:peptidoglycan hydrolase CwlO-like protein